MNLYYLARFLRKVLLKVPLWVSFFLGRALGLFFYFSGKRRTAFKNIKLAFPEKRNFEIDLILRESFKNFGLTIIETLIAPRIFKYIEIKGKENIREEGIFVGIHEGSWEFYNYFWAQYFPYAVLAKKQKNESLDKFLNELRGEAKLKVCFSLKELIKYLKKNWWIGLVIDHGAEDNALLVEFFSHLVPTPGGAVYLAKKFNRKLYPCFIHRKKRFSHILEIGKPIEPQNKDEKILLRDFNRIYEDYLKNYPAEYFWHYKRFKRKKDLDILVLSDGKPGHLKQSYALLEFFKEENYKVRSKIVEVRYKNRLARFLGEGCASLTGKGCQACGKCLNLVLNKRTSKELEKIYADIVISTGSLTAAVNKLFSSYLGAKSAVILKPNIPLAKFDLAIVPQHDRLRLNKAVKIKGALFYPYNLEEKIKSCQEFFNLSRDKKISLFLGGALRNKKEFTDNLKTFLSRLKEFSFRKNYKILVSTCRRTQQETEDYLEKEIGSFRQLEAIVYPRRANYDFVFEGFVFLSEIVFVSSESISMISETASLKRPCVCVFLEEPRGRHEAFLNSMSEEVSFLKKPFEMDELKLKVSSLFEENKRVVKEAIRKLR